MWGTTYRESYEEPSKVGHGSIEEATEDDDEEGVVRPDPCSPRSAPDTRRT
jgi:hypothetical protein